MQLQSRPKLVTGRYRRIGRGAGSGRGKTSGRGTKGQKARGGVPGWFEGGQTRLIKRLPLLRGAKNRKISKKIQVVNVAYLNLLPAGSVVDVAKLISAKIISPQAKKAPIKILGDGELKVALTVKLPTSKAAAAKIAAAGGKVES